MELSFDSNVRDLRVDDFLFKIRNDFEDLPAAASAATQFLTAHNASSEVIFAANLAIEELATNTIKYGYSDKAQHEITLRLWIAQGTLQIELCDDGNEFDPFSHPEPNLRLPSQERQIGGLGLHLVRNMLDTCSYIRREGRNVVRVSKKL